jgi:hypothetical protein
MRGVVVRSLTPRRSQTGSMLKTGPLSSLSKTGSYSTSYSATEGPRDGSEGGGGGRRSVEEGGGHG